MMSIWFPDGFLWFSRFAENNYKMWGSILCVVLVQIWFPFGFLMFSLWLPYVSFDSRGLPKIITRCEGAFCVLLWCKYVSFWFPYVFLMVSLCFLWFSWFAENNYNMWGSILCVALVQICFPFGFLMFSLCFLHGFL